MTEERKLIHRDDIPMEVMQGFEAMLQEQYPGFKVVCAGDLPEGQVSEEVAESLKELEDHYRRSLVEGKCVDCGKQMENFPPDDDDWEPPRGWGWFTDFGTGSPQAWQCPECDKAEREEPANG